MNLPDIVNQETWTKALAAHRAEEKAVTRRLDELAAARRRLPMVELKPYVLRGESGELSLPEIFQGRRQLITYHFMWKSGAREQCSGCTFLASHVATLEPLHARDTTFAVVTVGAWQEAVAYRDRFGWTMPWYSSADSEFGEDMGAGPEGGFAINVFIRDGDRVFRSYHTHGRGSEQLVTTWALLDLTPLGRQEVWQDAPEGRPQTNPYLWWPEPSAYAEEYARNASLRAARARHEPR